MSQFASIVPTTELEAINELLSAIGEAPITQGGLDAPSLPDVVTAVATFRGTHRAVLGRGWRFNTEYGYELAPDGTVDWTDTSGTTTTLNVWEFPDTLVRWELTPTQKQIDLDLIARVSRQYQNGGQYVQVFYDRKLNRDGLDSTKFDFLYIDPTWFVDFDHTPETYRQYLTLLASVRFQTRALGSMELEKQLGVELRAAERNLLRDQGNKEKVNLFDNANSAKFLGRHRRARGGRFVDDRNSPGLQ